MNDLPMDAARQNSPVPGLRAGTPAMTDTPPEFADDVRKCAGDSSHREAGGKDFAKQLAEGQGWKGCELQLKA